MDITYHNKDVLSKSYRLPVFKTGTGIFKED
ncbi:hypothetical protein C824_006113 [Schaedlerella arabinosiphila]|nr:hypothetical protein C824_006113 [Schaedlerella arabinosiphila]